MKLDLVKKLLLVAVIGVFVASCMNEGEDYVPPTKAEEESLLNEYLDTLSNRGVEVEQTALGVYYVIDSIGNGTYPVDGDTCVVKYIGTFIDGSAFDASAWHSEEGTFTFVLGVDQMIAGWTDGVKQIDEEGTGYLIIPSEHGYGSTGNSTIPPNTTLVFGIEVVEIKPLN